MFWNSRGWVSAPFGALFQLDEIKGFNAIAANLRILNGYTYPSMGEHEYWRLKVNPEEVDSSFMVERDGHVFPSIDFRFQDIPYTVRRKYLDFFRLLRPSQQVQKRVNSVDIDESFISVHVRNPVKASDKKANVCGIDVFIEKMEQYPKGTKFFISTMGRQYSDELRDVFGKNIVELPDKDYTSMRDAAADMYLLSSGRELVVSQGSTFSECSWWMGGCRQDVTTLWPRYLETKDINRIA